MFAYLLRMAVNAYSFLILVYILASWVPEFHGTRWYLLVRKCVDPYLNLFRRFIPRIGFIDFSPLVALFCLEMVPFVVLRLFPF